MKKQENVTNVQGFTLIELLVVVLIIGILAAVAVPQYQKAVLKTRTTHLVATVNALRKAADLYVLENGYPQNTTTLWNDSTNLLGIDIPYPDASLIGSMELWCSAAVCQVNIWGDSSKQGDGEIAISRSISSNKWVFAGGGEGNFGSVVFPTLKQSVEGQ